MNTKIDNYLDFDTWDQATSWAQSNQHVMPNLLVSQINKLSQGRFPQDAFTIGQQVSKIWMASVMFDRIGHLDTKDNIAYLGCWIGTLVPWLNIIFRPNRIFGFDSDPEAIAMADDFNADYVKDDWRFKGVTEDVSIIDWSSPEFVVEGELITDFVPDVIVNTSAEHMTDDWFLNTGKHTMVAMQTNNNSRFSGHINCVDSLETMQAQYPMRATIYAGEMVTPAYTRYMQIGFPA